MNLKKFLTEKRRVVLFLMIMLYATFGFNLLMIITFPVSLLKCQRTDLAGYSCTGAVAGVFPEDSFQAVYLNVIFSSLSGNYIDIALLLIIPVYIFLISCLIIYIYDKVVKKK